MANLFFLLSGEHATLPAQEIKAILEAEGHSFQILENLDQTLRIEADIKCIETVKNRAAFTKLCALELFNCKAEAKEIIKALCSTSLSILHKEENFAVRIKHVKNHSAKINSMDLERKLGEILNKATKAKVNLKNPDKIMIGILTDKKFIFGLKLAEIPSKPFVERRPKRRPFFHPSAMPPKLARCMVNLAKPKTGELVFDPFCGTGSMLIEAALMGCRILGLDVQRRMVKGTIKNLEYFNITPEGVIVADARNPPVSRVDCAVADPPYGRSSTTLRRTTAEIVEEFLTSAREMLDRKRRVCIAAPKNLNVGQLGLTLGYKHLESHFVYVHRSLTREIAVFEKV
ncbi:MAG: THUMP domain-containing protein [Candidatus Bathyarchaeia archaeon]